MIVISEKYLGDLYLREYVPQEKIFSANGVLFLHGYPGSQKNYDIAEHLALKGFYCVVMHYRGVWKSKGQYSLISTFKDVETILNYFKEKGYDHSRVSLIGTSWGGFIALQTLVQNPSLRKVILLAPFINLSQEEKTFMAGVDFIVSITKPFIQNYEKEDIVRDLKTIQSHYNPIVKLKEVEGRKVLIIHGDKDTICPIEHSVRIKSLFNGNARLYRMENQDHFLHTREALFDFCFKFLNSYGSENI